MPDDPPLGRTEDRPEDRFDSEIKQLIDRDLEEGKGAALAYARQQLDGPYWPIGLCIAWILASEPDAAADLYARHRLGIGLIPVDGWPEAQATLLRALGAGQVEALGARPQGSERVPIAGHEWIDLKDRAAGSL